MDMKHYTEIVSSLLTEAAPGKPETMAQRHDRLLLGTGDTRKKWLAFSQEVLKDWKSGDMALSRMESAIRTMNSLSIDTPSVAEPRGMSVEQQSEVVNAFKKKMGKLERIGRLGKGYGFKPGMGKITPNEIVNYMEAVVDFCKNDWADINKKYGKS
jgi:hypothetical protein